ncbi:MAG: GIY-YIG nuclease family protein [Flavobacteriales bacterium]|nr:GIY-YIG nuclease family protein [Flavobacteriales bacterium]
MKPIGSHNYFVYIVTNRSKKVLYIGMTNHLQKRLEEHHQNALGPKSSFAGKYNCYFLLYWEHFQFVNDAYAREKELKGWRREKKEKLITDFNPNWDFLNDSIQEW